MRRIIVAIGLVAMFVPRIAAAQDLTIPGRPIVAIPSGEEGCPSAPGTVVNGMILPDGNVAKFSIPPDYTFMMTGIEFVTGNNPGGGVPTGGRIGFILRTITSGIVIAEGYAVNTGQKGSVSGNLTLSTPMRVTSNLCLDRTVGQVTGGTRTWIRGFLVKGA